MKTRDEPSAPESKPLSFVVVVHDMSREARRTLFSLSRHYQRDAEGVNYEVLVLDNASATPLGEDLVRSFGPEFRYLYVKEGTPSPVRSLNLGAEKAYGENLVFCIDGARILSPGIVTGMAFAFRSQTRPIVTVLSWHLGPTLQNESIKRGYDQSVEDALLDTVPWHEDGYSLFEISCLAASSAEGWFGTIAESNCLGVPRGIFDELGGFDEAFIQPGGGLCNHDFLRRACALPKSELLCLLGEGTFHQFHGGVATNVASERHPWPEFAREYEALRGEPFRPSNRRPFYLGRVPPAAERFLCPRCGSPNR